MWVFDFHQIFKNLTVKPSYPYSYGSICGNSCVFTMYRKALVSNRERTFSRYNMGGSEYHDSLIIVEC